MPCNVHSHCAPRLLLQVGYEFAINYCCRLYEDPATIQDFYHPEAHSRSSLLHASPEAYDYNVGQKARARCCHCIGHPAHRPLQTASPACNPSRC